MFKRDFSLQWIIFGGPWLLAVIYGVMAPLGMSVITSFLLLIFGSVLVISAKVSSKKKTSVPIEFGFRTMNKQEKIKYITGYAMMFFSMIYMAIQGVLTF